jgi:hypothetical protein
MPTYDLPNWPEALITGSRKQQTSRDSSKKKKDSQIYVMNCAQHFSTTLAEACRDFLKLKRKFRGIVQSARPATTHPHCLKYRRRLRRHFRLGPTTFSGGDRVTVISSPRKSHNQVSSSPRRLYDVCMSDGVEILY